MLTGTVLTGTVTGFSDDRGLGTVTGSDGRPYPFHVIEIADGSRTIDVGQPVVFRPLARFGAFEAGDIRKV